ncbi:Glucose-6-phosphate 1-dehydrogenase [Corynebacterium occultum]|uniref:Glucose-6-phosphate 1-dehydrogenase n=1 Tax=Corynebacterium occultum TaxID=2675219 RepID=A0A6B8WCE4_9CORY|nr:glucose-6-phosphate dehydrogenase [Corynebacterium occultum]QGU07690.1 Glucose-6-phosphate 1-dehydrogenase [Corynebacterium occultum]
MERIKNLVILGATGDLASRLLLPGLGTLLTSAPQRRITVIGADRAFDDNWSDTVTPAFASVDASGPAVDYTQQTTRFVQCDVTSIQDLSALLATLETPACLYFAIPPQVTMKALAVMAELELPQDLFLALEKPIGHDRDSAKHLNALVARLVSEDHIFRVDHFLGLPAVLNFVGLRFANQMLEPLMNRDHVESIEIVFDETLGLEGRAGFYDTTGAFRDMIQSHLLQVMSLVMMDPPARFDHVELPALTAHILRSTKIFGDDPATSVVRGRYTAGHVGGQDLPDYTAEDGVDPANNTETFAQVTVEVDTWRWNGVPVTLRSGKAIGDPRQEIVVRFRRPPHEYPQFPHQGQVPANVLRMQFDDEQLTIELNMGGPFDSRGMTRVTAQSDMATPGLSAYGSVLRGILDADPTFSVRGDAAEQGWRIIEQILASFTDGTVPLQDYPAGGPGPQRFGNRS